MIDYSMEELIPVVAKLSERYTSKESTSISYDKARQLMEAVIYCIEELRQQENLKEVQVLNRSEEKNVEIEYDLGYQLVIKKVYKVKELYEKILNEFQAYGNVCLSDTFLRGIPGFLRRYDARFEPQNQILTMDYPTLIYPTRQCGVDAIYSYLKYIEIEQNFLRSIPKDYVCSVLESYHADYQQLLINLSSIVLRNLIGAMIARKPSSQRGFTVKDYNTICEWVLDNKKEKLEDRLYQLLRLLIKKQYDDNQEMLEYLSSDMSDFSVEFMNVLENDCLDRIFLI